jgi:aminoglycoside/choline kinase family phosphotransferase
MPDLQATATTAIQELGAVRGLPTLTLSGVEPLTGQASARGYVRLHLSEPLPSGEGTVMLVLLGDDPLGAEEATSEGLPAELPFTGMRRFLAGRGIPVPAILVDCWQEGWQLQTDLGDRTLKVTLEGLGRPEFLERMTAGLDFLVDFQARVWREGPDRCQAFDRHFDHALLRWELDHFTEWGLQAWFGADLDADALGELSHWFDGIARRLAARGDRLVHRDFQSTNLMATPAGLVLIDFQDAHMGTEVYDLVAYLRDSYVELTPEELEGLLAAYVSARSDAGIPVAGDFRELFHLQTVQRKLKDAGRFVFIDRVKGKPGYLPYVEPSLGYVSAALDQLPELAGLKTLLGRWVPWSGPSA